MVRLGAALLFISFVGRQKYIVSQNTPFASALALLMPLVGLAGMRQFGFALYRSFRLSLANPARRSPISLIAALSRLGHPKAQNGLRMCLRGARLGRCAQRWNCGRKLQPAETANSSQVEAIVFPRKMRVDRPRQTNGSRGGCTWQPGGHAAPYLGSEPAQAQHSWAGPR